MPHINTSAQMPGIVDLMMTNRTSHEALGKLANAILFEESPLSRGEREIIAAYVSVLNNCRFCSLSHIAIASGLADNVEPIIEDLKSKGFTERLSLKMNALLKIASEVQKSGRDVKDESIAKAKALGASDGELHDTVLVAAAFCMFNRYVDGLQATTPEPGHPYYKQASEMIVSRGYQAIPS
ncbi:MAG: carboxymuconolactone decarboxylase family protein [Pseudomonadota bacterium]|nr:carboxymuconolactone decarboxylase family protein [Pseudomonadota bacterium]